MYTQAKQRQMRWLYDANFDIRAVGRYENPEGQIGSNLVIIICPLISASNRSAKIREGRGEITPLTPHGSNSPGLIVAVCSVSSHLVIRVRSSEIMVGKTVSL